MPKKGVNPAYPYVYQNIEIIKQYCEMNDVPVSLIQVDTLQKAKELPCVFNNWGVFYKGNFETVNLLFIYDSSIELMCEGEAIMFAVNTYEEIEKNERLLNEKHIIALLFVRPSLSGAKDVINEFNYIHYNSGKYCSIYAIGYTNDEKYFEHHTTVAGIDGAPWYYNDAAFIAFKNKMEQRLKWKYSGEIELIILQSNPEGREILDFRNYLAIDVNYGIKNQYIDSFNRFMESLIRSARSEVETKDLARKMNRSQYSIKDIIVQSIGECKKIPVPIQDIVKDSLFYRTSTSYS